MKNYFKFNFLIVGTISLLILFSCEIETRWKFIDEYYIENTLHLDNADSDQFLELIYSVPSSLIYQSFIQFEQSPGQYANWIESIQSQLDTELSISREYISYSKNRDKVSNNRDRVDDIVLIRMASFLIDKKNMAPDSALELDKEAAKLMEFFLFSFNIRIRLLATHLFINTGYTSFASQLLYETSIDQLETNDLKLLYLSLSNHLMDKDFVVQINEFNYSGITHSLQRVFDASYSERNIDSLVLSRLSWYLGLLDNRFVTKQFSNRRQFEQALFLAREAGQELEQARYQRILCQFELGIIYYKNSEFNDAEKICRAIDLNVITAPKKTTRLHQLDIQNQILKSNIYFQQEEYVPFNEINQTLLDRLAPLLMEHEEMQFSYSDVMDNYIEKKLILGDFKGAKLLFEQYKNKLEQYQMKGVDIQFINRLDSILSRMP